MGDKASLNRASIIPALAGVVLLFLGHYLPGMVLIVVSAYFYGRQYPRTSEPKAVCPYCRRTLRQMPRKTGRCPRCDEKIVVKTRPGDGKKVLLTEEQAETFEAR